MRSFQPANFVKKMKRRAPMIPGARPGSNFEVVGSAPPELFLTCIRGEEIAEYRLREPAELRVYLGQWDVVWLEVKGLGDKETLTALAQVVGISDLTLEDVANQNQRAKIEQMDDITYVVASGPHLLEGVFEAKQVDFFVRGNLLVSFVESDQGWLRLVKERLRKKTSRVHQLGVYYLLYALIDVVVDHYFPVLQDSSDALYELEDQVVDKESLEILSAVNRQRRNLFEMQRALRPSLEVVQTLLKRDVVEFDEALLPYFKDLRDHLAMGRDAIDARREHARTIIDMSLSVSNQRMSETMKVLTLIATIFIPLSFIAGLFGMNFNPESSPYNMPELSWTYGYPAALGLMLVIAMALLFYFYKKKWIGRG